MIEIDTELDPESEAWREHNRNMKAMREKRRDQWAEIMKALERDGFAIETKSPYLFRIWAEDSAYEDWLDFYPTNKRAFDHAKNKWMDVRHVWSEEFIRKFFKRA